MGKFGSWHSCWRHLISTTHPNNAADQVHTRMPQHSPMASEFQRTQIRSSTCGTCQYKSDPYGGPSRNALRWLSGSAANALLQDTTGHQTQWFGLPGSDLIRQVPQVLEWLGLREFGGTILPFFKRFLSSSCGVLECTVQQGGPQRRVLDFQHCLAGWCMSSGNQCMPGPKVSQQNMNEMIHVIHFTYLSFQCCGWSVCILHFQKCQNYFLEQIPTSLSMYSNATAFICV